MELFWGLHVLSLYSSLPIKCILSKHIFSIKVKTKFFRFLASKFQVNDEENVIKSCTYSIQREMPCTG